MYSSVIGWMASSTTILSTSADAGREAPVRSKTTTLARRKYFTKWGFMLGPSMLYCLSNKSGVRVGCEYGAGTSATRRGALNLGGLGRVFFLFLGNLGPAGQSHVPCNQPRSTFVSEVRPGPGDHHHNPVAESDQKKDVYEQPRQPGQKTGNMNLTEVRHGCRSAYGRQTSLVPIFEILTRLVI